MTFGQLFREVSQAQGRPVDEDRYKFADSVAPDFVNQEIPEEILEKMRAYITEEARRIDDLIDRVGIDKASEILGVKSAIAKN